MELTRKPFQGVWNIIRFNWHFYVLSLCIILFLLLLSKYTQQPSNVLLLFVCYGMILVIVISLLVSWYVYDVSGLYAFGWMRAFPYTKNSVVININAGFDETSRVLEEKFNSAALVVLDFYDPLKHTEVSIKRARKAYPPYPGTMQVISTSLPLENGIADMVFVIFAAHEIRSDEERIEFFKEVRRVIKPDGKIFVTEHLRDTNNFLAYNFGFLHFYSKQSWKTTFTKSKLILKDELKHTPFISTFILVKDGN